MVSKNLAAYEPVKQSNSVLLYWRSPEEWAEVLHGWVRRAFANRYPPRNVCIPQADSTGQLNTILTFYDIIEPPVPSPLSGIPMSLLRKAISILTKTTRAQIISVADGEGVRFLAGNTSR